MESIERNADRQDDVYRKIEAFGQLSKFAYNKAGILKGAKTDQMKYNSGYKQEFFVFYRFINSKSDKIIDNHARNEQDKMVRCIDRSDKVKRKTA